MGQSENIWNGNIEKLQKIYPHIADKLLEYENNRKNEIDEKEELVVGVEEVAGEKVLYTIQNGEQMQLDTLYDSEKFLQLWFEQLEKVQFKAKMFMFGLGNGMYVRKILKETAEDVTVIIYEPSIKIFCKVMHEFDMDDIISSKRVVIILKCAMNALLEEYFYSCMDFRDIEGLQCVTYLNYKELFYEEHQIYMAALQGAITSINSTQAVIGKYGVEYYINTFANFPYFVNSKSMEELYKLLPKGVPAIVVAGGPSLDKNILELKNAENKAFIIAVDTALRPLIRHGISPNLCISIDAIKMPAHFKEAGTTKIPMVCYLQSNRVILEMNKAAKIFMNDLNSYIQHFLTKHNKVLPVMSSGGSVANDAFSIAQALGFETIILVGQDLAYPSDRTHSIDTVRGEKTKDIDDLTTAWVEGIDGELVRSTTEFQLYLQWFEEQIVKYKNLRVIDATEGGAKIHGSIIQTLRETIEQECTEEVDFAKAFAEVPDYFSDDEKREILAYINEVPQRAIECIGKTNEGIRLYQRMLELVYQDKYMGNELKRTYEKAKKLGEELENEPVMEFMQQLIQEKTTETLRNIYQKEEDVRKELITICNTGKTYMETLRTSAICIKDELPARLEVINQKLKAYLQKAGGYTNEK